MSRPEKSLHFSDLILQQVYKYKIILNTVYICSGDETETGSAEEQPARDKSPGDEVIRFIWPGVCPAF
jgi:hypothetical protein